MLLTTIAEYIATMNHCGFSWLPMDMNAKCQRSQIAQNAKCWNIQPFMRIMEQIEVKYCVIRGISITKNKDHLDETTQQLTLVMMHLQGFYWLAIVATIVEMN